MYNLKLLINIYYYYYYYYYYISFNCNLTISAAFTSTITFYDQIILASTALYSPNIIHTVVIL